MFGVFPWLFLSDKDYFLFGWNLFAFAFHTLKLES